MSRQLLIAALILGASPALAEDPSSCRFASGGSVAVLLAAMESKECQPGDVLHISFSESSETSPAEFAAKHCDFDRQILWQQSGVGTELVCALTRRPHILIHDDQSGGP
ncbi:MAG: hypothetical protein AAGF44_05380 [Pseudomonadota bacterium]